jgi:GNAT superfamily N-acetyltransferase
VEELISIRNACASDAAGIAGLTAQLGYTADPEATSRRLARINGREDHLVVVAVLEGRIVGWLHAHAFDALESGFRAEIVGMVVSEGCRRRGVGRCLVRRAEQWALATGAGVLVVRSNMKRVESHSFYPALGFSASKTQAVYRKKIGGGLPGGR